MKLEVDVLQNKWMRSLGFAIGYFMFTTILFFALILLQKVSYQFGSYLKIAFLTLVITSIGIIINRMVQ